MSGAGCGIEQSLALALAPYIQYVPEAHSILSGFFQPSRTGIEKDRSISRIRRLTWSELSCCTDRRYYPWLYLSNLLGIYSCDAWHETITAYEGHLVCLRKNLGNHGLACGSVGDNCESTRGNCACTRRWSWSLCGCCPSSRSRCCGEVCIEVCCAARSAKLRCLFFARAGRTGA